MERRKFIPLVVVGTTTFLAGNFLASCSKDDDSPDTPGNPPGSKTVTIDLNDPVYATLKTPGNAIIKDNILIMHLTDDSYQALSKICTHEGCTVGFSGTEVVCPCHGSRYTTAGVVINGPATRNLTKYTTALSGNILTIS